MTTYKMPYFSYGTIYGTVRQYDSIGNDAGPFNLTGYGIFFTVKDRAGVNVGAKELIKKSVGTGITVTDAPNGLFSIFFSSNDLNYNPSQYFYNLFVSPDGPGTYIDGTTRLKSIGSGIFEIIPGVRYGTN